MGLHESLARLSHPLVQSALLLLLAGWLIRSRPRLAATLATVATAWLLLCATPAFAQWLQQRLDRAYPFRPAADYPQAQAIVVLGGGALPGPPTPQPSVATGETPKADTRLGFALQLYRQHRAGVLLLSGADQAQTMASLLRQQGVPAQRLLIEASSQNTHQNALNSARLLHQRRLQQVLLVTSGVHMRRAVASFRAQGVTVWPAPAQPLPAVDEALPGWLPQRQALRLSGRCLREYLGLLAYRLRGWI